MLFLFSLFSCNKDVQTGIPQDSADEQVYHGFLYIGCAEPPYYMNFDSLVSHCSVDEPLPETLPAFTLNSNTTMQFCRFDGNEAWIGTANNFDIEMDYQDNFILLIPSPSEGFRLEKGYILAGTGLQLPQQKQESKW